jgi:predicted transcriptional regulator
LQELRAALDHAPGLVTLFLELHQNHRVMLDNLQQLSAPGTKSDVLLTSPEATIHDFFRQNANHFSGLEEAAEAARYAISGKPDDIYANLKMYLNDTYAIDVEIVSVDAMSNNWRIFDQKRGCVSLSEGLDQINRNFQLAHVLALVSCSDVLDELIATMGELLEPARARCRVELANYFAAALLMPYEPFLELAESSRYDVDRMAAGFGVTFEMACQRLTTLQRKGAQGVPFFFLRIDKAGNVTKRFNATPFTLAEQGGSCPIWNIHTAFAAPGMMVSQFVEMPDSGQFFTISRTTDRPVANRHSMDRRLVVTLGCERAHVTRLGYAAPFNLADETNIAKIGINCHICPRQACAQRAHEPLHVNLSIDANRRGSTRYES